MARRPIEVFTVGEEHLAELMALWSAARCDLGVSHDGSNRLAAERLLVALGRSDVMAHLARLDGEPVGFAVTSQNLFGLTAEPELTIELLHVSPGARRKGVAQSLLSAVLASASRLDCEVIVSNVPSTSKDANRFFARLGFSPVMVRRVVPMRTLRRKLEPESVESAVQVLRRRRSVRARLLT